MKLERQLHAAAWGAQNPGRPLDLASRRPRRHERRGDQL